MHNLVMPGAATDMGGGWETRRSRRFAEGHDWILLELGRRGSVEVIEIDTRHFKGNYPESVTVQAVDAAGATVCELLEEVTWQTMLPRTQVEAHDRRFVSELEARGPFTHVRVLNHPDGGISRLRLYGRPAEAS